MQSGVDKLIKTGYLFVEVASLVVAFVVAHCLRGVDFSSTQHDKIFLYFGFVFWVLVIRIFPVSRVFPSFVIRVFALAKPLSLFAVSVSMVGFFFKEAAYSRLVVAYFILLHALFVCVLHTLGDWYMCASIWRDHMLKRICLFGLGSDVDGMKRQLINQPELGYYPVHSMQADNLDHLDKLKSVLIEKKADEIAVCCSHEHLSGLDRIIRMCDQLGVRISIVPELSGLIQLTMTPMDFLSRVAFRVREVPLDTFSGKIGKRLFDVLFSVSVLTLLSPLFFVLGLLIKVSSKGPVFFKQARTGYGQREFMCYKFRSMRVTEQADTQQATEDDPRKTWIGEFMRRTNMDELPQFINVLKGDMSVVGPRPHMLKHTEEFSDVVEEYLIRHFVRPGITGWAQVNGWRGPTDTEEKIRGRVEHDLWYVENWSFMLDMKIILLTVFGKKTRENAF